MLPSDKLSAHFTFGELGIDRGGAVAPYQYWPNLRRLATYLEVARAEIKAPLNASGWRSPGRNEAVGGSDTSSHLTGDAADVTPIGVGVLIAYNRLKAANKAGRLPDFDQIIYYPFQHLHVGLGSRNRRQFLIRVNEKRYTVDTSSPAPSGSTTVASLGAGSDTIAVLAVGFVALVILFAIVA